jgi:hypothetical protein
MLWSGFVFYFFLVSIVTAIPVADGRQIQNNRMAREKEEFGAKPRGIKRSRGAVLVVRMYKPSIGTYGTNTHRRYWLLN